MKERPILFKGEMVRAILAGVKTQTRRLCKPHPVLTDSGAYWSHSEDHPARRANGRAKHYANEDHLRKGFAIDFAPYAVGDHLWVRETWAPFRDANDGGAVLGSPVFKATWPPTLDERHDAGLLCEPKRWRPSIHTPRCVSRITLEVTSVRVERLRDISEEDARAEGVTPTTFGDSWTCMCSDGRTFEVFAEPDEEMRKEEKLVHVQRVPQQDLFSARDNFRALWDRINGDRAPWASNPWLWVVGFRRLEAKAEAAE